MLTDKQQRFVDEYLIDLNATQAAIRTGYSAKSAHVTGSRLLSDAKIQAAIAEGRSKIAGKLEITQERILGEMAKIGFSDIRKFFSETGSLKRVEDLDDDAAGCISAIEVVTKRVPGSDSDEVEHTAKIKLWDKGSALLNMGKHLGMFTDRHEHTGKDGEPLGLAGDDLARLIVFLLTEEAEKSEAKES